MNNSDRKRVYAVAALWTALAVQAVWIVLNAFVIHAEPAASAIGLVTVVVFAAFAIWPRGWLTVVVRVVMAAEFLLAVADRFGVFGGNGSPGVSWGDFAHFVAYTQTVTGFLPSALAPALAVIATIAEIVAGVGLLFGVWLRVAALGSAVLLGTYAVSMALTLPVAELFSYSVPLLGAGMVVLAMAARTPLTMDALVARRRRPAAVATA